MKSPIPSNCKWVTLFLWGPQPLLPSTPLLWPLPLLFYMGESSSLAKEQYINFSVTRKHLWEEHISLEPFNPKGQQGYTFRHLRQNTLIIYWLLFCSLFATGSISTAAEPQSTKEIPTYVNGWIEDIDIYLYWRKKENSLHLDFLILQMTKGF